MTSLSFNDYLETVTVAKNDHPEWRLGQTYFNVLEGMNIALANQLRGSISDPFYEDANIKAFLSHVRISWNQF